MRFFGIARSHGGVIASVGESERDVIRGLSSSKRLIEPTPLNEEIRSLFSDELIRKRDELALPHLVEYLLARGFVAAHRPELPHGSFYYCQVTTENELPAKGIILPEADVLVGNDTWTFPLRCPRYRRFLIKEILGLDARRSQEISYAQKLGLCFARGMKECLVSAPILV